MSSNSLVNFFVGDQDILHQNTPLWDKGYFKLKAQESQQTHQEASLEPPFRRLKVETFEK